MTNVTNTGVQPLVIAGGTYMAPGVETDVANWADAKKHPITKFQLEAGTLVVGEVEDDDETDPDEARKADLVARIKEIGGKTDKRWSVEKLEAALVEAQQRASVVAGLNEKGVEFDDKLSTEDLSKLLAEHSAE